MKDGRRKEVLVIMPAYNEAKNIRKVLDALKQPEMAAIADVLVVNDASSDDTNWIVKEYGYTLVTHVFNLGYGSALQLAYKYAIRRDYQYVIQMDADGQHDAANVLRLYEKLKTKDENGCYPDIVLGGRFMKGSGDFPISFAKKIAYTYFRGLIHLFTGRKIADPTTGLQGLRRRVVLHYSKYGNFDDRYPDANMLVKMLLLGFKVEEIPAVMHVRTSGVSMHSGLKPFVYMFRMTFSVMAVVFRIWFMKKDAGIGEIDEASVENA